MKSKNPFICLMPFSYRKGVSVKATTSMRCLALIFNYTTFCFDAIKNHTSSILFHQMDTVEACSCLRNNCWWKVETGFNLYKRWIAKQTMFTFFKLSFKMCLRINVVIGWFKFLCKTGMKAFHVFHCMYHIPNCNVHVVRIAAKLATQSGKIKKNQTKKLVSVALHRKFAKLHKAFGISMYSD